MNRVDYLKAMTESYSVKFMEFTRVVSKAPDAVVCRRRR